MKKRVMIVVSFILALIELCSPLASAAMTETAAAKSGAEVFEAWNMIHYSSYDYMVNDYVGPSRMFVEQLSDNPGWNDALAAWRILTFDVKSEVSYLRKEQAYYNTFLFNILYDPATESLGTSFISAVADTTGDVEKNYKKIGASTWKKLCDANADYRLNPELNFSDVIFTSKLMQDLGEIHDIKVSMSIIGDVTKYLGYCKTVLDVVEKISKIEAVLQSSEETAQVLLDMQAKVGNNLVMKASLADVHDMVSGKFSEEAIAAIFAAEATLTEVAEEMASALWKEIVAEATLLGIVLAGQAIGKFTSDSLFNSSGTIATYYKLEAMCSLENAIKGVTLDYQRRFESNTTTQNAKLFIAAYKLLYKTYLEELDCAASFVKQVQGEGIWNQITNNINAPETQDMLRAISEIKSSISSTLDYIDTNSYNYYLDVLATIDESGGGYPTDRLPVVQIEPELELNDIKTNAYLMSNQVYTQSTTLTGDLTTYGDLTVYSGTLDLNGHTLTVHGDLKVDGGSIILNGGTLIVYGDAILESGMNLLRGTLVVEGNVFHTSGDLSLNKGTLDIGGDYRIQGIAENSVGDTYYTSSNGTLTMAYAEDLLRVGGDFVTDSNSPSLTAGRIELHGGLQELYGFSSSGSHCVVFKGEGQHRVHFNGYYANIQNLEVEDGAELLWSGYMNVGSLQTDVNVTSEGLILNSLNLNGYNLSVEGNAEIGDSINFQGGTLAVEGDVLHTGGKLTFNKGALDISGDYRIQSIAQNSAGDTYYTGSYGRLVMDYAEDLLRVGGDFVINGNYNPYMRDDSLTAGQIELHGGMQGFSGFSSSENHRVVFKGEGQHRVAFSESDENIQNLVVENGAELLWSGYVNVGSLQTDVNVISDGMILSGMNLNEHDLSVTGNAEISGSINFRGGTLAVEGDVLHTGGTLTFNKGTLDISGDYRIQCIVQNSAGDTYYTSSSGKLVMAYAEDLLRVGGDFVTDSYSSSLTAGRIELHGGLQGIYGFSPSGSHRVVFTGKGQHRVAFSESGENIQNLVVENGVELLWSGYMNVGILQTDMNVTSEGLILNSLNLNGHNLSIEGDVEISGSINFQGGTLAVKGDVLHTNGDLTFNKGTLDINGDYRIQGIAENSVGDTYYTSSNGTLTMAYAEDLLRVGGNFVVDNNSHFSLTAGRIELHGGLEILVNSPYSSFYPSETHRMIFTGDGQHRVHFNRYDDKIQNLVVEDGAELLWSGYMNVGSLQTDVNVTSGGLILYSLNLNGYDLSVEGDVEISGSINFQGGTLSVEGNALHTNGDLTFNKGTLDISGDYRIQSIENSAGEDYYTSSTGYLSMQYDEDLLRVGGDMFVQGNSNHLTAGTLQLAGNFTQISGSFSPYNTHTTVLNGTEGIQSVSFSSTNYGFNILELTRDGSWYVFSPDPCWKVLKEAPAISDVPVTNISLSARNKTLTVGDTFALTAIVYPADATDPTLTWSSSNDAVATVDGSGLVTAHGAGTAVIRAKSVNGLYRTCTVTVHEVFSGLLTVGTANALPGERLALPVIAWDNPGFSAMRLSLTYDPAVLTLVDVQPGPALAAGDLKFEAGDRACTVLWYDATDMTADGVLFYGIFQVAETAPLDSETAVALQCSYGDICMDDHTNVGFQTQSGSVWIKEVLKGDLYEDGTVDVHDILVLQQYLTGLQELTQRQLCAGDLDENGTVNMKDIVRLAQVLLDKEPEPVTVFLESNRLDVLDANSNFTIFVGDAVFNEGGYAEVQVSVRGCTGIAGLRLKLNYDTARMGLMEIRAESDLMQDTLHSNLVDQNRETTWITWYSADNQILQDTVFTLKFKLLDQAFSGILPISVEYQNGDICTELLAEIPTDTEYGIVHTLDYNSNVQFINPAIQIGNNGTGTLTGKIVCGQKHENERTQVFVAFYNEYGQMLDAWTETIQIDNGTLVAIKGNVTPNSAVKVYFLSADSLAPLCKQEYLISPAM